MIITRDITTYRTLQANLGSTSTTINQLYIKTSTGLEVDQHPTIVFVSTILNCRTDIVKGERYVKTANMYRTTFRPRKFTSIRLRN
jgi:flagellar hook-associated protein 3 FlgL